MRRDLREEVLFIEVFDRAVRAVMDRIGADKRSRQFPELTGAEIDELEKIVQAAGNPPTGQAQDNVSPSNPLQPSPR